MVTVKKFDFEGVDHIAARLRDLAPELWHIFHPHDDGLDEFAEDLGNLLSDTINDMKDIDTPIACWQRFRPMSDSETVICSVERIGERLSIIVGFGEEDDAKFHVFRKWVVNSIPGAH